MRFALYISFAKCLRQMVCCITDMTIKMSVSLYNSERTIIVDSKNRVSGTPGSFVAKVTPQQGDAQCDRVALKQISIPKSWYDIPAGLNVIYTSLPPPNDTITITPGNYTLTTFMTEITSKFQAKNITVSAYNTSTNKLTFTANAGNVTLSFERGMAVALGFDRGVNLDSNGNVIRTNYNLLTAVPYTAPNCVFISTISKLYLHTSMCDRSEFLQEILVCPNYPGASMIWYENHDYDVNSRPFTGAMHSSHYFILLDSFGTPVELNGVDMAFTLVIYKRNDVSEMMEEDIRIRQMEALAHSNKK